MKVALLTDGVYPYVIGGMQKHSFYLARELARKKHTVYLFHYNESNYAPEKLEFFSEEERKYIRSFVVPFPHKKYFPLHYLYESYEYSQALYEALKPFLKEIDFVFAQGFCAWALLTDKYHSNCPKVAIHLHGFEMFQDIPSLKTRVSRYFLQSAVKKNLEHSDYVISYGGKITTILKKIIPSNKIWEIPAGIESSWIADTVNTPGDKVRFVFVGRYERRKGIPELNAAIKELLPKADFYFDFIGNIPDEYKIKHPAITYHNRLSSETEIQKILSTCDVLVCPSYAEGMPNVIMEGMARGLAIIATNVGAVSLLVNNDNGWLIEKPDSQLIINALSNAILKKNANSPKKSELLSKKQSSLDKIQIYLLEKVTDTLLANIERTTMDQHAVII